MIDLDELQRSAMRRLRGALTRDVNRHSREMVAAVADARARCVAAFPVSLHEAWDMSSDEWDMWVPSSSEALWSGDAWERTCPV